MRTRVLEAQNIDETYLQVKEKLQQEKLNEKCEGYRLEEDDLLVYKRKLYISNCVDLKKVVMDKIQEITNYGHPRYQNTITIERKQYIWYGIKKVIEEYISQIQKFEQIKEENQHCYHSDFILGYGRISPR